MHLKMLSIKLWPFGDGLTMISYTAQILLINSSDKFESNLTRGWRQKNDMKKYFLNYTQAFFT